MKTSRPILVIDVGGTHVKLLVSGMKQPMIIPSGPTLTPEVMVRQVKSALKNFPYDLVSIGYPVRSYTDGPCGNHTTWERVGSVSISGRRLDDPQRSLMMRPCRRLAATEEVGYSSSA
jgi:hypothetical protein